MSLFGDLVGDLFGDDNPADAGMQYLEQIPDIGKEYYNPFIERGKRSGNILEGQYDRMAQDPVDYLDQIMRSYRPSSGYDFKQNQMLKAAGNTAAAGGFRGTQNDQQDSAAMVQALLGDDMQQFLQNVLGIQGSGLQGHQGFQNQGYNASSSLADYLGTNLSNQAGLAFQGQSQENANHAGILNSLIGAGGSVLGAGISNGWFGGGGGAGAAGGLAANAGRAGGSVVPRINYANTLSGGGRSGANSIWAR